MIIIMPILPECFCCWITQILNIIFSVNFTFSNSEGHDSSIDLFLTSSSDICPYFQLCSSKQPILSVDISLSYPQNIFLLKSLFLIFLTRFLRIKCLTVPMIIASMKCSCCGICAIAVKPLDSPWFTPACSAAIATKKFTSGSTKMKVQIITDNYSFPLIEVSV